MTTFADIHNHSLFNLDDGAKTEQEMYAMIEASYRDGVRTLCLTPHFHPGYFGDNHQERDVVFRFLKGYVKEHYPDMQIFLGNELRYSRDCLSWLAEGYCLTMNRTRYVLVDFSEKEPDYAISKGLDRLLNAGYIPILAHAERYRELSRGQIQEFRQNGVLIQVDAQSLLMGFGLRVQHRCKGILAAHLADMVSSDAHDLSGRPPQLGTCFQYIENKYGAEYARELCQENAWNVCGGISR